MHRVAAKMHRVAGVKHSQAYFFAAKNRIKAKLTGK
jgi:hypothetical protein